MGSSAVAARLSKLVASCGLSGPLLGTGQSRSTPCPRSLQHLVQPIRANPYTDDIIVAGLTDGTVMQTTPITFWWFAFR